jgi:hypothetical protein
MGLLEAHGLMGVPTPDGGPEPTAGTAVAGVT